MHHALRREFTDSLKDMQRELGINIRDNYSTALQCVTNRVYYMALRMTSREIIDKRHNSRDEYFGLESFFGDSPKSVDIGNAANYLIDDELKRVISINKWLSGLIDVMTITDNYLSSKSWLREIDDLAYRAGDGLVLTNKYSYDSTKVVMERTRQAFAVWKNKGIEQLCLNL